MRHLIALAAAAPLALLSACGDTTPVDQLEVEELDESAIVDDAEVLAAADGEQPAPEVSYPGSYTLESDDGIARLTLGEDDTYEYVGADGTTSTGRFSLTDDGRLMIEDFDGKAGYFALSDGDLYRLTDENTPVDEITVEGRYARVRASAPPGSTNSIEDKRGAAGR